MPAVDSATLARIFRHAPFVADIGAELETIDADGAVVSSLIVQPRHLQSDGFVHAGVQTTLADHTMGMAAYLAARDGFHVLTAELRLSLLRAARGDRLHCRARVIKAGRQLIFVEAEVRCLAGDESQLVSKASATMAVVPETSDRAGR